LQETPAAADEQDRALVRRYLAGQRDAASGLVDRYQKRLFNVALRMLGNVEDAEDVTQRVFLNAFLKRRKRTVTLEAEPPVPAPGATPDRTTEAQDLVRKALMRLKPDDRAVVVLKHFAFFSYEEIAEVMEIPVRTVKSRLFTARDRLRLALRERGHQAC
jgi:RNA polymerase sigma-70 factor (ECF subfamily)